METCAERKRRSEDDVKGSQPADDALIPTDFETSPISFTSDLLAGIMLGTTFMKVACGDDNARGYSCCVANLIWHMAKVNAKSEGEAPAATKTIRT